MEGREHFIHMYPLELDLQTEILIKATLYRIKTSYIIYMTFYILRRVWQSVIEESLQSLVRT